MKTAEEIEKALDELMIARGEHPTRVRNPLYGEERELAIALAKWAVADYKERVKAKVDTAGWSMLSPMLTPYQTEDVMNQIKELLDTTN
jgi:hypothetical protein